MFLFHKVQKADFQITKETEFDVLRQQMAQILQQNEVLKVEFQSLESKWQDLENSVADDSQNLRFQLETETKERENDIRKVG